MNSPVQFAGLDHVTLPPRPLHLAIGMFDGVHLGHQAVIESALHSARRSGGLAGVLTFWPHPSALFRPAERTRMLMSPEMKLRVLGRLGVDAVIEQPFTREFAAIKAGEFLPRLRQALPHLASVYVGENWRFGASRAGDVGLLLASAAQQRVPVVSVPRIQCDGQPISSTRVRASTSSMSFTFGRKHTLGKRPRACWSAAVVPHSGSTPNSYSGSRSAVSRKIAATCS